ncbi:interleukin-27 receptor subunit alpha [Echinops telfairi]|uniref:Interleukin-27 receptor subunit alpha n=1 Tax=Echinops telfairi TaxID=9371 RepID=A0ABM0J622_ECHTE|nr:interleukin-27 receptor subunit alpha [Echinops telfairi]
MQGALAVPFRLLPLLLLLWLRTHPEGSPTPPKMQCYRAGASRDLNCSWEPLGDPGAPSAVHFQSQKYHLNRSQVVAVPARQSWVIIPREQFTEFDTLLVWGTKAGKPLWPQISVNLATRVNLDAPWLCPDLEFSEDEPLETVVQWTPPTWLSQQEDMVCQFYYRRCQEEPWTLLEPELTSRPLVPIEIQDLELATGYEMSGRCRMQAEEDLWGEWSPTLSFQTPPSAPKEVWVSGNLCETANEQKALLLWKVSCSAPQDVAVSTASDSKELLVTWQQGAGGVWEHVVDWVRDGDPPENFNWVWLPTGNLSVLLSGNFEKGVPYKITVTAVSPGGVAPAPSIWGFIEELAPLVGPKLWRLQDAPAGIPTIAWGEIPRHQVQGHLTHYTLCVEDETDVSFCMNVSAGTQNATLPNLPWGPCKLWMTASTRAGQGPPGPSIQLHLPDNTVKWKVLRCVLLLLGVLLVGLALAISCRCVHLWHKVLPRWVWEKVPDPANSHSGLPHIEEGFQAQPSSDMPILEVQEMEPPPGLEAPQPPTAPDSGYEKHFLPTPEELGLLGPSRTQVQA